MKQFIVLAPHKVLNQKASPVDKIDKKTTQLIADMKTTLSAARNPKGVGLAAPQIGVGFTLFVMKPKPRDSITVCINPEIIWHSNKETTDRRDGTNRLEGCLSINNIWGSVKRYTEVKLKYMNEKGEIKEELFKDFPARIIQHEVDHLNGILFTQRVLEQKSKLFKIEKNSKGEEVLEEFKI